MLNHTIKFVQKFVNLESSGGIILVLFAILALILDNSPLAQQYQNLLNFPLSLHLGQLVISHSLLLWVNDGLMPIFFFLVGMEIKREILEGELNSLSKLALPGFAALGGMLIPACIYIAVNMGNSTALKGWAIPTATDIAFALGVLSLLGRKVPITLKVFLTALAILDDFGAIIIIALFYSHGFSEIALFATGICILALFAMNCVGIKNIGVYVVMGIILWVCLLKSGIHPTLSGVILALAIPLQDKNDPNYSPLKNIESGLHPWVAFGVLPIFSFFNAGVSFTGISFSNLLNPIPIGIAVALFFGKQLGVFGFSWIAVKSKIAELPNNVNWVWLYGIAILCGIGFTMSLFIGGLAFGEASAKYALDVRLGVLIGSFTSGIIGFLLLFILGLGRK